MSNRAAQEEDDALRVGQHYKRTDGAGLVFEVVGPVGSFQQPHFRVRRIDDPTDMRVFARTALMDTHLFRAIDRAAPAARANFGHLRLKPS